jgi:ribosomal protein L29
VKKGKKKENYSQMSPEDLLIKKNALTEDLFKLRLASGGAHQKNLKAVKMAKRNIARVLTALAEKTNPGKKNNSPGREG